jgi:S-(hydroxymethyl)glutathione dehydrogenase/alcohol dehydrogenase
MTRAAVLRKFNDRFVIEDIDVDEPRAGEVKVRLSAAGICQSDDGFVAGKFPLPLPAVAGHEGAGVVEAVGAGVTSVVPGDHVILSAIPQCGACFYCTHGQPALCDLRLKVPAMGGQLDGTTRYHLGGEEVYQYCFTGTFSEVTVAPERSVVKIPAGSNMVAAALIGCAVTTGVGAARNTADIRPGHTVAVLGCGGVGLNVVQGAKLAGADRIVAIDVVDVKLDLARRLGATNVIDASKSDPVEEVRALTEGRGADVAFEVTGRPQGATQVFDLTRRGGEMVFIGVAAPETVVPVRPLQTSAKVAKGCLYGSALSEEEFPRLLQEYHDGLVEIDLLVSNRIPLEQVNDGFDDLRSGRVARSVIVYD